MQSITHQLYEHFSKQVADRAGVSGATVSRVLNGKSEDRIPVTSGDALCRAAAGLLSDRLAGRDVTDPQIVLPAVLSVGETT